MSLLEGIFLAWANYEWIVEQQETVSYWVDVGLNVATICVETSQILSGLILIWAIWQIRSYLASQGDDGSSINLKTLVLHAFAFGLFIVSVLVNLAFFVHYFAHMENSKAFFEMLDAGTFM